MVDTTAPRPLARSTPPRANALVGLALSGLAACSGYEPQDVGSGTFTVIGGYVGPGEREELLIVLDDSPSMRARRDVVPRAIAEMVRRMAQPICFDANGPLVPLTRVDDAGMCPIGAHAERSPARDLNVGIITTSLGAAGVGARCASEDGVDVEGGNRGAHLVHGAPDGTDVPTWQGRGWLAWDPQQTRTCEPYGVERCPGIASVDELVARVQQIVDGIDLRGCGDEAPLEAAYRFLADPAPPLSVDALGHAEGVDEALLATREGFVRPGSTLWVAMVTDEDDCSFRADGVGAFAADPDARMPRARAECAQDPSDRCCASCVEPTPEGCTGDGGCAAPGCSDLGACPENLHAEDAAENERASRCVDGKRRFGIDFTYPLERYVNAFHSITLDRDRLDLADEDGDGVPNPLRDLWLVNVVAITNVPWASIARRDAGGVPDLVHGLGPGGYPEGGYQTVVELEASGGWDVLSPSDVVAGGAAPRRLLELTRALESGGGLASIEPPRFEGGADDDAARDVGFQSALDPTSDPRSSSEPLTLCVDRVLEHDADGDVPCHVVEAFDSDGDDDPETTADCDCEGTAGRETPRGGAARFADMLRADLATSSGFPGSDCLCVIPQLPRSASNDGGEKARCQSGASGAPSGDGWCDLDGRDTLRCSSRPAAIRFVGGGEPRPGAMIFAGCASP